MLLLRGLQFKLLQHSASPAPVLIQDAYMVVANVTVPCASHADRLLEFAVRMHAEAHAVCCSLGQRIKIRVGMHTGPVVSGVVGRCEVQGAGGWGTASTGAARGLDLVLRLGSRRGCCCLTTLPVGSCSNTLQDLSALVCTSTNARLMHCYAVVLAPHREEDATLLPVR